MPEQPLLTFKDLVLDAADPRLMAEFWASATGLVPEEREGGLVLLRDDAPPGRRVEERAVWVVPVPEPQAVKHRVHLDVHTRDVGLLLEAGAAVVEDRGWVVLRDVEGGELCAFVREDARADGYRVYELVVDCVDPAAEAGWWGRQLGVEPEADPEHDWHSIAPEGLPFDSVVFVPVPEPKTAKNRVHWDLWARPGVTGGQAAEALVAQGATLLATPEDGLGWWVLASPEGHEFCVFQRS